MNLLIKIFLVFVFIFSAGCLEDDDVLTFSIDLDDSAKLIKYVEDNGDYPNSPEAPGLISADKLFSNLNNFWIIDMRDSTLFVQGHIESAINTTSENLMYIVDSLNSLLPSRKVILVSKNGQSSSYFTCILRIAGYKNVFNLKYGMASWNIVFANEWIQSLGTDPGILNYNNENYPKNELNSLPIIEFPSGLKTIEEKIEYRIRSLLKIGFYEGTEFVSDLSEKFNKYLICYGQGRLYYAPRFIPPLQELGHPIKTTWYNPDPLFDFRSTRDLQTLPKDKEIVIYSGDGQLSACIVAYLRYLGYDAKTVLFGANQLFYPRLESDPELARELFSQSDIMNFPFVTGK